MAEGVAKGVDKGVAEGVARGGWLRVCHNECFIIPGKII